MACTFCGKPKIVARGYCAPCYQRWRKTGSVEYQKWHKPQQTCSIEGCLHLHVAKGLCDMHYRRQQKHGDTEKTTFGYGSRQEHPLYESWTWQRRIPQGRVSSWDDFWTFVNDVHPRPDGKVLAKRLDISKPWGPNNFRWAPVLGSTSDKKEYQRVWRAANPLRAKHYGLKRMFGITLDRYMEMYEQQGGKCMICSRPGASFDSARGKSVTLVVDHCHKNGDVGALLCPHCNKGLGSFGDSAALLDMAAAYIRKHRKL